MTQVSLEDAEKQFRRLIEATHNGEEIVITQDHEPLARLVGVERPTTRPRFGFAKGVITYMADDFDAPLEDFREYMSCGCCSTRMRSSGCHRKSPAICYGSESHRTVGTQSFLSIASAWEMAIKHSVGKLDVAVPIETLLGELIDENGISWLSIDLGHVSRVATLPLHHRDPFDRLLIAQSLCEDVPLVSSDPMFDAYGIERIW